ncbi:MAG TPA: 2-hydroxyacid dehydrogenase [Burkholderiales bacterium]
MSKPDVLLIGPLFAPTMAQLDAAYTVHRYWEAADKPALLKKIAGTCEAVATSGGHGIKAEVVKALPKLKIISSFGVGYDSVDTTAAKAAGAHVTNTPDVLTDCVADTTWALILSTVRKTAYFDRFVRDGKWLKGNPPLTDKVWGEKLGIIGLGRIGKAIAKRGEGFGMQTAYHGRHQQAGVAYTYYPTALELARNVKILVVVTPGGKETDKIVSREVLEALGPKGYLINISRGSTVDEEALIQALAEGKLGGAGLDVFVEEPKVPEALFKLDNVVLQPHVGSGTHHTRTAMGQLVVDNLAAYFAGKPLLTEVPETL